LVAYDTRIVSWRPADVNASGAVDAGDLNSEIFYLTDPM